MMPWFFGMETTNIFLSVTSLKEGSMSMAFLQPTAKQIKPPAYYKVTEFKINMRDLPTIYNI